VSHATDAPEHPVKPRFCHLQPPHSPPPHFCRQNALRVCLGGAAVLAALNMIEVWFLADSKDQLFPRLRPCGCGEKRNAAKQEIMAGAAPPGMVLVPMPTSGGMGMMVPSYMHQYGAETRRVATLADVTTPPPIAEAAFNATAGDGGAVRGPTLTSFTSSPAASMAGMAWHSGDKQQAQQPMPAYQ
jgi:hypothetical protein